MSTASVTKTITGQNEFSDALTFPADRTLFNFSLSGTFVATVTVQRSLDGGSTWVDVEQFTATAERVGDHAEQSILYRAGVKTGEYTSGSPVVRLSY